MSEDLIRRSDAIEALQKEINKGIPPFDDTMGAIRCGVRLARNIIEDLPSADRPQGEWIPSDTDGFVCSVCKNGYRNQPTLMGRPMFEYCPVCGARMKGADDEQRSNNQADK